MRSPARARVPAEDPARPADPPTAQTHSLGVPCAPKQVLDLQRIVGNQAVGRALEDAPHQVMRVPTTPSARRRRAAQPEDELSLPPAQQHSLPRSEFDSLMQRHFGVGSVVDGTQALQEGILRSASGNPSLAFTPDRWQEWSPGSDSPIYAHIVNGFRHFVQAFGGIPAVGEIVFFHTRYAYDRGSASVVTEPNTAAAYGGGTLLLYRKLTLSAKPLPTGRSTSGPAPLPLPHREDTVTRIITHELGHGLVEVGLTPAGSAETGRAAPDPQLLDDYRAAVGWTSGSNPRLFDAGVPAVSQALAAGTVPESSYEITQASWNEPRWVEQPISAYMTTHPAEDFPEAVMTFASQPDLLRARSPRRFQFMLTRAQQLAPLLRRIGPTPPAMGDFPASSAPASHA